MIITKIVVNNFKSIGESKNVLYPDKTVSVIIGKIPEISLELELSESEIKRFGCSFDRISCFEFSDEKLPYIRGGLASYISEKIVPIQECLLDSIKSISGVSNDTKKAHIEYNIKPVRLLLIE